MYQHPLLQEAKRNQVKHYFSLTLKSHDQPHPIPSKEFLTDNLEDGPDDHGGGGGGACTTTATLIQHCYYNYNFSIVYLSDSLNFTRLKTYFRNKLLNSSL